MIWGWADHIQGARRISARLSDWVVNNAHTPHLRPHQQCIGITSCAHSANNNSFIGNNLCKIPSIHVSWSFQSGIFYVKSPTCVPLSAGRWPSQRAWLRLVMVGLYTMQSGSPTPWNFQQQAGWEAWNADCQTYRVFFLLFLPLKFLVLDYIVNPIEKVLSVRIS